MNVVSYEGRDLEVLGGMKNYYAWILETFRPYVVGEVVEYGAGAGAISERLLPMAHKLTLVEPSVNLVDLLRTRFAREPQVEIISENVETHSGRVAGNSVDTIVMVNVLEHIEDDRAVLLDLFRILKPGGHLLIFVPALQFLMSKIDLMHGHFRRYHKPDLVQKIAAAGGDLQVCRYFDMLQVAPWFLVNTILGATTFNPTMMRISDGIVVPMSRALEQIVTPPFGKNLIAIATKQ